MHFRTKIHKLLRNNPPVLPRPFFVQIKSHLSTTNDYFNFLEENLSGDAAADRGYFLCDQRQQSHCFPCPPVTWPTLTSNPESGIKSTFLHAEQIRTARRPRRLQRRSARKVIFLKLKKVRRNAESQVDIYLLWPPGDVGSGVGDLRLEN